VIARVMFVLAVLAGCGDGARVTRDDGETVEVETIEVETVDVETDVETVDVETADGDDAALEVADADADVVDSEVARLDDTPGVGAHLVAVALAPDAPAPVSFVIDVEADGLAFTTGAAPTFWHIPAPEDGAPKAPVTTPWTLAPGERLALDPPRLIVWTPGATALTMILAARDGEATIARGTITLAAGAPADPVVAGGGLTLVIAARTGATPLGRDARVGLTLDGALATADVAERVAGPIVIKHYAGARRWLLRPGCDSDLACAPGGASHPCVSTCACTCDERACDCDFTALEAAMQEQALAAARRVLGVADGADPSTLTRARVHWVWKRSLGGTASCDVSGELDASPETWGRFFAAATRAAIVINTRLGFRLIDVMSPMNEVNHPLQDGAHENSAGQPTVGGIVSFVDAIAQPSCAAGRCCAPDRYIVTSPDVPALAASAMAAAHEVLAATPSPLAPAVALSLYLDVEQVDPLQVDAAGAAPSIVTPVAPFMRAFADALAGRPFPDELIVVDTYPGSWGAPWFETADGIVHHMDPASRRVVRVDPIAAADAAIERARRAADDVASVIERRPEVLLGEVGWSTFDGDEGAQAAFATRLVDALLAAHGDEPKLSGLIWFKSHDRAAFAYPTWTTATNPLGGDAPIDCEVPVLGAIVCTAEVLARMESQWGLARRDGVRKPAWEALVGRWARATAGPADGASAP